MSSSIFNFEYLVRYRAISLRTKCWHLLLAGSGLAILVLGTLVLQKIFPSVPWLREDTEVIFVGTSHTGSGAPRQSFPWRHGRLVAAGLDQLVATAAFKKHAPRLKELKLVVMEIDEFTLLWDSVSRWGGDLSSLCYRTGVPVWDLPGRSNWFARSWIKVGNLAWGRGVPFLHKNKRLTTFNILSRRRKHVDTAPEVRIVERPGFTASREDDSNVGRARLSADWARRRIGAVRMRSEGISLSSNVAALKELAREVHERSARLLLISYPCHRNYYSQRPATWDLLIKRAVREVEAECKGTEILYWDFTEDARFRDEDFTNGDHLNSLGRKRLSSILVRNILSHGLLDDSGDMRAGDMVDAGEKKKTKVIR